MLIDKLKAMLTRHPVSEETMQVVEKAGTTRELLHGLDALHTRNEMEFNEVTREIEKLEAIEEGEGGAIRAGELSERRKRNALLRIRRLRKQMENLDNRLKIYDRNMSLHLNLIGKVQEMEAMSLRGVSEKEIDKIVLDFEEKLDSYMNTMASAQVVEESVPIPDVATEHELQKIEREVLDEEPPPRAKKKKKAKEGPEEESLEDLERKIMTAEPERKSKEEARTPKEKRLEAEGK